MTVRLRGSSASSEQGEAVVLDRAGSWQWQAGNLAVNGVLALQPDVLFFHAGSLDIAGGSSAGLSMSSIFSASPTSFCKDVMMLSEASPEAASLTSSKVFLRSAISASRIAS